MEKKVQDTPLKSGGLHVVLDIMTEVERVVTEELAMHPRFADLQNRLGLIRFQRQDFQGAKIWFEKALSINKNYQVARSNLGFSLLELGRVESAEKIFLEALRPDRKAHALNELAILRLRQGNCAEAEGLLREAAGQDPRNALYPHNLAAALFLQNKVEEAAESLREASRVCPPYSDFFSSALLFSGNKLVSDSYREYISRQEMNPYLSEVHDHLGHAFAANGFLDEAEAEYRTSLRTMPSLANYYGNLALLYSAAGKEQEALAHYLKAVDAEPDSVKARVSLAFEYSARGLPADAMRQFEAARSLKPGYPDIRYNLGLVYLEMERREDAVKEFRAALKSNPNYLFARNSLAFALFKEGALDEALEEYRRVFSSGLSSSDILVNMGIIHRQKGALDKSLDCLNRAICLNADYAPAYFQLGQTYQAMGQKSKARCAWKIYLERAEDDVQAAEARKAMEEE